MLFEHWYLQFVLQRKYYLNPEFGKLPDAVKDELKSMCVLFTEEVGGVFELLFEEDGELMMRTSAEDNDVVFDEIGAGLLVKRIRSERKQLLEELSLFYRVVFLGEKFES